MHGDLRDLAVLPPGAAFALVTGTPPYLRPGSATPSRRTQRGPAHLELRGGIEAYCLAAARWLAPGGRFVTCAATAQLRRVSEAATAAGLRVTRRLEVIPRAGKAALFSVQVMRPGRSASSPALDPPLVVRDAAGQRTPAFRALRERMGMPP